MPFNVSFWRMGPEMRHLSTATVLLFSPLPTTESVINTISILPFTSGMAVSLFYFSLFLLVEQPACIPFWCAVKRFWAWLIILMTKTGTTPRQWYIGPLRNSSLNTKKFNPGSHRYDFISIQRPYPPGSCKSCK